MTFTVHLTPGGQRFEAEPDENLLAAALRQGVNLPYGCRDGACGSCEGIVLEGEYRYTDGVPAAVGAPRERGRPALLCQAAPASDLTIELEPLGTPPVQTFPCRVRAKRALAHDVVGLELEMQPGKRLDYLPGQYVDVVLRDGRRRAFSLASSPRADGVLELHVRRVPGGEFSEHVAVSMRERAIVRVRGPLGRFHLRDGQEPVILVAGGTGFAPIKAMVESALARGDVRPLHLYRGVRSTRDLYLDELAREWAARFDHVAYVPVLSEPHAGDDWRGRTGFVHEAVVADFPDLGGHAAYLSGPPVMVDAGREAFVARGMAATAVYSDAFDYAFETGHDRL